MAGAISSLPIGFSGYSWGDAPDPPMIMETEHGHLQPHSGLLVLSAGEYVADAWGTDEEIDPFAAELPFPSESPAAVLPVIAQLAPAIIAAAPVILQAIQGALPALRGLLSGGRESLAHERDGGIWDAMEASIEALETALIESGFPPDAAPMGESQEPREPGIYGEIWPAIAGIVAALAPVAVQVVQSLTSRPRPAPAAPPALRPAPAPPRPVAPAPAPPTPAPMRPPSQPTPGGPEPALAQLQAVLPLLAQLASQLSMIAPTSGQTPAPAG
jgi:hypothetical protein